MRAEELNGQIERMLKFGYSWSNGESTSIVFIVSSPEIHVGAPYSFLKTQRLSFRKDISPRHYYKV